MQKFGLIHNGMPEFFKKLLEVTGAPPSPASQRRPDVCDYCGEAMPAGHDGHVCNGCRQEAAEEDDSPISAAELAEIRAYVFAFIPAGGE